MHYGRPLGVGVPVPGVMFHVKLHPSYPPVARLSDPEPLITEARARLPLLLVRLWTRVPGWGGSFKRGCSLLQRDCQILGARVLVAAGVQLCVRRVVLMNDATTHVVAYRHIRFGCRVRAIGAARLELRS